MIPGLYDGHNKAFFFFHYEQIRFPNSFTRTRTVYNPRVLDGWFRYQFGSEVREVNVLDLAARIKKLKRLQDHLGAFQDCSTQVVTFRRYGEEMQASGESWDMPFNPRRMAYAGFKTLVQG